jgi:deoxyribonuclease IV
VPDQDRIPAGRRIGAHLPIADGLLKAADRAREIGATAIQIFTDNPTSWRRRADPPAELDEFVRRLAEYDIAPLAIHAPYLINLAGPRDDFWEHSCVRLANELRVGALYGARFVVVHIGSHRGLTRDEGLARLAAGLRRVLDEAGKDGPLLVLENSAGMGDGLGSNIADLADVAEVAARAGVDDRRLGFCLDTAHLWGAGYGLDTPEGLDELLAQVDARLGREKVVMLHLNDSRTTRGSRLDRHEHIGAGLIGYEGLRSLLCHEWLADLPTYLETPGMDTGYDAINLERVRLILAGEPLPELPPEAFVQRGSRSRSGSV